MPPKKRQSPRKIGSTNADTRPTKTPSKRLTEMYLHSELSTPPTPCRNPREYSEARVLEGAEWVQRRLAKPDDLSPLSNKVLTSYEAACMALLATYSDRAKGEPVSDQDLHIARSAVWEQEMALAKNDFLRETSKTSEEREAIVLGLDLLKLRRFEYQARYGDYFQTLVRELRIRAKLENVPGADLLSGRHSWLIIQNEIEKELASIDLLAGDLSKEPQVDHRNLASLEKTPTTMAVIKACDYLRFNWEEMRFAIGEYAKRNLNMHSGLTEMIANDSFRDVMRILLNDLHDLPKVFVSDCAADEVILARILKGLLSRWGRTRWSEYDDEFYNPEEWYRNTEWDRETCRLRKLRGMQRTLPPMTVFKDDSEVQCAPSRIGIRIAKEIAKNDVDSALLEAIFNPSTSLPDPTSIGSYIQGSKKRPASVLSSMSQHEQKELTRQKIKAFDALQQQYRSTHNMVFTIGEHFLTMMSDLRRNSAAYHGRFGMDMKRPEVTESEDEAETGEVSEPLAEPLIPERRSSKSTSILSEMPKLVKGTSKEGAVSGSQEQRLWEMLWSPHLGEYVYLNVEGTNYVRASKMIPPVKAKTVA